MLSGIGPPAELERHGIPVRVARKGVGTNLQDRYEVGVVARVPEPFELLADAGFTGRSQPGDPAPDGAFQEWLDGGGIYESNGALLGIILRSSTRRAGDPPDLYIFGVPGFFRGYEIGYSEAAKTIKDNFTFAVLKGHTDNRAGRVTLRSKDPFQPPDIHFKYFEEGDQPDRDDVQSVVDGVEFVEEIFASLRKKGVVAEQLAPKPGEDLHRFVRDNAWGHHASCTCRIGPDDDDLAVLDQDFQVRGTKNLRVVDASVFPRIPGLFILCSVYMISEKASEVIIEKYR
jgi:choline dehydrogenase